MAEAAKRSKNSSSGNGRQQAVLHGEELKLRLEQVHGMLQERVPGPCVRVWAKMQGFPGEWPAITLDVMHCPKRYLKHMLMSQCPAASESLMVAFHGSLVTIGWVRAKDIRQMTEDLSDQGTMDSICKRLASEIKSGDQRMTQSDRKRLTKDARAAMQDLRAHWELSGSEEARRLSQCLCREKDALACGSEECAMCSEGWDLLACGCCMRRLHAVCLDHHPFLDTQDLRLTSSHWHCNFCGHQNSAPVAQQPTAAASGHQGVVGSEGSSTTERVGLTPDWIIEAAAFDVFQLQRPAMRGGRIKGLLDPCTNSKLHPNVPAEILYDKQDDGLDLKNSWANYYVFMNPEFTSSVQWRFVNRAIDEVERGNVPALILLCRGSTDTQFWARMYPYPRVLLERGAVRFKDYDNTPIAWGTALFCLASEQLLGRDGQVAMYRRFCAAFRAKGEVCIPIDQAFVESQEFPDLLARLKYRANRDLRDHWIECTECHKWRVVTHSMAEKYKTDEAPGPSAAWTCRLLHPPLTDCSTPQTRVEARGERYSIAEPPPVDEEDPPDEDDKREAKGKAKKGKGKEPAVVAAAMKKAQQADKKRAQALQLLLDAEKQQADAYARLQMVKLMNE